MKKIKTAALLLALCVAAGCSQSTAAETTATTTATSEPEPLEQLTLMDMYDPENDIQVEPILPDSEFVGLSTEETTAAGINKLGSSILRTVEADEPDAAVVSGFSGYSALAEAYNWANVDVVTEIDRAIGGIDYDYLQEFKANAPIETGTMLLIDDETVLNTEKTDKFTFKDLQAPSIINFVNDFVYEKTHGMIPTVIRMWFDKSDRAVILDTLYFKGSWRYEFDKENTKRETFHGKDRDSEVDFMHGYESYPVNPEYGIIELPYKGSSLVMDIMYEPSEDLISESEKYSELIKNGIEFTKEYDIHLAMPKFETETTATITDAYKNVGITKLFSEGSQLNLLANDLFIGRVLQKAKIIVDEEGTEAAAVTVMIAKSNGIGVERKSLDITIDKPFVYAIRDTETNIVLFSGYVNNLD